MNRTQLRRSEISQSIRHWTPRSHLRGKRNLSTCSSKRSKQEIWRCIPARSMSLIKLQSWITGRLIFCSRSRGASKMSLLSLRCRQCTDRMDCDCMYLWNNYLRAEISVPNITYYHQLVAWLDTGIPTVRLQPVLDCQSTLSTTACEELRVLVQLMLFQERLAPCQRRHRVVSTPVSFALFSLLHPTHVNAYSRIPT